MKERFEYGKVTCQFDGKELDVLDFITGTFKEGREVKILELEEDCFFIAVENPENSGRSNEQIFLSKESFYGLFALMNQFVNLKNIDLPSMFQDAIESEELSFQTTIGKNENN